MHYCWCYPIYSRCIPIKSHVNRPWHCFLGVRVFKVPEEQWVFCIFCYSLLWYRWPVEFEMIIPCDFLWRSSQSQTATSYESFLTSGVSLGLSFLVATGSLTFLTFLNDIPFSPEFRQDQSNTVTKKRVAPHTFARQKTMVAFIQSTKNLGSSMLQLFNIDF